MADEDTSFIDSILNEEKYQDYLDEIRLVTSQIKKSGAIFYKPFLGTPGIYWFIIHMLILWGVVPMFSIFVCLFIGFEYNAGRAWDAFRVFWGLQSMYDRLEGSEIDREEQVETVVDQNESSGSGSGPSGNRKSLASIADGQIENGATNEGSGGKPRKNSIWPKLFYKKNSLPLTSKNNIDLVSEIKEEEE
ncbi:Oidioi.mRNA.OKI2018_I69.chr2.g7501.t1.cds [Oikopleura dioica]|uniref:Oidioi.mRNA.OKI2018_I69.chr2.g7501.t1.cds n=1 Tax=Oikopleura dioica TaxID=34765 RepID=A0ABN7TCZ7_OIKDI|nr:Oidioi.mRNA.OKI2018_I69.chr2.g7501.t1.cds [Oikopleura dioica]